MFQNPDFHMHSTFSDGTDTPAELLEKIRKAGIDAFSLTDHDTYDGCLKMREYLRDGDPLFLGGIELTCEDETGKYHILGYCYNSEKDSIRNAVELTHTARVKKAQNRVRFLEDTYGFTFTDEEIDDLLKNENPGKPHFVALLQKKGYVKDKKEGFALLSNYHGEEPRLTPEEGIDAILRADGVPVLAHGILADGSKNLSKEEITDRVKRLKSFGLMGLECYYSTYTKEQTEIMLSLSEEYRLLVTAGSDYHGSNKTVTLGETNRPDPSKMERFYRVIQTLLN